MAEVRVVTGDDEAEVGEGERAYVYAGGTARVAGGRVWVGSGGAARVVGEGRATLVEDGLGALLPERGSPAAVLTRGEVMAECGRAWVGPRAAYRATGSTDLWVAPGLAGEVDDGRAVRVHLWPEVDADAAWAQARPASETPPATTLPVEPGDDPVAWLAPLTAELERLGGTVSVVRERSTVTLTVTLPDPAVLADALRTVLTPPTLRLLQRGDEGWSLVSHAVTLHVERVRAKRGWFGRGW